MTPKHTPGPWALSDDLNENLFGETVSIAILDEIGFPILSVEARPVLHNWPAKFPNMDHWADGVNDGSTYIEREASVVIANARLASSAPDLLDALGCMLHLCEMLKAPEGPVLEFARSAIAKATGEITT